jgi:hypothetical protein
MKIMFVAAALMLGGAAVAQTTTATTAPSGGQMVQPSNANPELDARGIPVISDPAVVPAGFNHPPGMGGPLVDASERPMPQPATQSYPPCTRQVTDNCVQTYERGVRR